MDLCRSFLCSSQSSVRKNPVDEYRDPSISTLGTLNENILVLCWSRGSSRPQLSDLKEK